MEDRLEDENFIVITKIELDLAFNNAENDTADMFMGHTCGMETKDGDSTCPICYFRGRVKHYLGIG